MSEGVRQRTAASGSTSADRSREDKALRDGDKKNQQQRSLLFSILQDIASLIWFSFKNAVRTVTLLYVLCVILMYSSPAARELVIYLHPLKNPFENLPDPASFGLPASTVNFYISGPAGQLGAWDIPGKHVPGVQDSHAEKHAHLKDGSPIVLYFHGNAYTRGTGHRLGLYKVLTSLGYHTITIDYRGFGDSDGKPSENGLIEDGVAAMKWIRSQSSDAPIYIWGHSLGSGVAGGVGKILCDEGSPPAGIILEAPFNNVWEGAVKHPLTVASRIVNRRR